MGGGERFTKEEGSIVVPSKLRSATVFPSGAELIHTATAGLIAGNNELVIEDVSDHVESGSIRVNATGDLTILSVTFALKPILAGPAVKRLKDSILSIKKEQAKLDVLSRSDNELLELLRANRSIAGTAGLNVAELEKMVDYYRQKSSGLMMEISGYKERSAMLDQLIAKLESEEKEEEEKGGRQSGRIVIQLVSPAAGTADFIVSYMTPEASWTPFYDLKAGNTHDPLRLLYKARLVQTSGIDWKQVRLTLSTAAPNQKNAAPELQPWFLGFIDGLEGRLSGLVGGNQLKAVVVAGYGTEKKNDFNYAARSVSTDFIVSEHAMNTSFDIAIPYDILGNGKEQDVTMKEYDVPCTYQYYVAPGLDENVYLLSEVPGWEKLNLLPGEASITIEGTYIGKSNINPGSTDDTLKLTLGSDKRVTVKREKMVDYSSVKFLGSNKKQVLTYEITVRNNKKEKIQLLVKDQYPISTGKEIESELLESGGAEVNGDTGMLSWKVELPPGESKKYRFSYSIKYPKDRKLNFR